MFSNQNIYTSIRIMDNVSNGRLLEDRGGNFHWGNFCLVRGAFIRTDNSYSQNSCYFITFLNELCLIMKPIKKEHPCDKFNILQIALICRIKL